MHLYIGNGDFSAVKNACSQGCLGICFCKHLMKMFNASGAARGYDRNGNSPPDGIDQLNIKTGIGAVPVDAVEQYFSGP